MSFVRFCLALVFFITVVSGICTRPRIRRVWGELTLQEQELYVRAITHAYESGRMQEMSRVHINSVNFRYAHHNSGFFLWHRWFVFIMEEYLRSLGPEYECLTIPYWDWEYHDGDMSTASHVLNPKYFSSKGTEKTAGCVRDGFFVDWKFEGACVTRDWDGNYTVVSQKLVADMFVDFPHFGIDAHGFRSNFEAAPHSNLHNWMGGNMGSSYSTYDPIFYLHHANVDRLFSMWQDCHDYDKISVEDLGFDNYVGTTAGYNGIDEVMPYGSRLFKQLVTPRSVFHIVDNKMVTMDYSYSRHRYPGLINQNRKGCHWDLFPVSWPTVPAESSKKLNEIRKAQETENRIKEESENNCTVRGFRVHPIEVIQQSESNGREHLTTDLYLGYNVNYNSDQITGIRFSLNIPSGVLIKEAYIQFLITSKSTDRLYLKIQAEKTISSISFASTTSKNLISSRSVFPQKIYWNIETPWSLNETSQTPNIASLVQNIIDEHDWEPKNNIGLIIRGIQSQIPNSRTVLSSLDSIVLRGFYCTKNF